MLVTMLKGKIHRAVVRQAELNYVGSITVDPELMQAAGIYEYELVQIVDVENGNRFETYTIAGEPGSGMICLNGAAARQVQPGDHIIIMCYCQMEDKEVKDHKPKVVFVDDDNKINRISSYEKYGKLTEEMMK
ncbi:MAG: aspartate 1-decarboxylase [Lachnospiraceae bacterium]|nr:aspartate 1-decarboxylase [Lachnospiraceae bacterium]